VERRGIRWAHVATALSCAVLFGAGAAAFFRAREAGPSALLWASLCSQGLWVSLAVAGALAQSPVSVASRLGMAPGRLSVLRVALAALGFVAFSHVIHQTLWVLDVRHDGALARIDEMAAEMRTASVLLTVVALGIAPGIGEEVLFRGFVQRGLAEHLRPALAVLLASMAFGLAHGDVVHGMAAFAMGLYLGTVAWAAGSIRPAIACHVLNNTLGVLALPAVAEAALAGAPQVSALGLAFVLLASATALVLAVRGVRARARREPTGGDPPSPGRG
jgi:membrane protease YdiL (CAAX protease family)